MSTRMNHKLSLLPRDMLAGVSDNLKWPVLRAVQACCFVWICWSLAKVVLARAATMGAVLWNLMPVLAGFGLLVLAQFLMDTRLSLALPEVLSRNSWLLVMILAAMAWGMAALIVYDVLRVASELDMLFVAAIVVATIAALILMASGRGMDAFYVLILSWPLLVYEASPGGAIRPYLFYGLDPPVRFETTGLPFLLVLLVGWCRLALDRRRRRAALGRPEVWLFLAAGLVGTVATSHPGVSWASYLHTVVVPMLGLGLFISQVQSWDDVRRLSQVLAITVGLLALVGFYYSLYRDVGEGPLLLQFQEGRDC